MAQKQQLTALRQAMEAAGVAVCYIPTGDDHNSEYVGDHFKCREYISGFTGSAGTLIVTQNEAGLFTDGRYFLQARRQLQGTGIALMPIGEPGTPTEIDYIVHHLAPGQCLALDGRVVNARTARQFSQRLRAIGCTLRADLDLPGQVWQNRPALRLTPAWPLDTRYCGEDRPTKLQRVRAALAQEGCGCLLLCALDEIAWLTNLRADDIACSPVVTAFAAIEARQAFLFVHPQSIGADLELLLQADGFTLRPYEAVYEYVAQLTPGTGVWLDSAATNFSLFGRLPQGTPVTDRLTPPAVMKSEKNATEIENTRLAHLKDGVAVTRFLYRLKTQGLEGATEMSAAREVDALRAQQDDYIGPSFDTIAAYGPNGAVVHYQPTDETNAPLAPRGFLLVDSGGHYLQGTTDITRTVALGPLTDRQKALYTAVLKGNLNLGAAVFKQGCTGRNLDILARAALWQQGLDYNHGTGHGVGYLLNVHEGPNAIRWPRAAQPRGDAVLVPGMITSNEPGIYLDGEFGVRLENLILCVEQAKNEYGRFLAFETLTLVPFDRDAIQPSLLTAEEKALLNAYHSRVAQALCPLLNAQEAAWLQAECAPL